MKLVFFKKRFLLTLLLVFTFSLSASSQTGELVFPIIQEITELRELLLKTQHTTPLTLLQASKTGLQAL